ncbi:hypothetical protein AVEN_55347-1 [Araneus ventricosus]|uniref:Uncharacterized protein n=1 Tax=Araneus ventricosus TaxID=182803 RepID=A0A4Y2DFN0_ARAVE|nr:hypothetical protein AVEN_55347-1 [Araneus ventricosus]
MPKFHPNYLLFSFVFTLCFISFSQSICGRGGKILLRTRTGRLDRNMAIMGADDQFPLTFGHRRSKRKPISIGHPQRSRKLRAIRWKRETLIDVCLQDANQIATRKKFLLWRLQKLPSPRVIEARAKGHPV